MATTKTKKPRLKKSPAVEAEAQWIPEGKVAERAKGFRQQLKGRVLCIDPSSGSELSVPGFAIFQEKVLIEAGTLEISRSKSAPERLKELAATLRDSFPEPFDLLIIEYVPPFMSQRGGGGFRTQAVVNLHRAIGVSMACTNWKALIQVPPQSWRRWVEQYIGAIGTKYKKSDARDALALGMTVFHMADLDILNRDDCLAFLKGTLVNGENEDRNS